MHKSRHTGIGRLIVVLAALLALAPLSGLAQRSTVPSVTSIEVVGTCVFDLDGNSRMQTWTLQDSCVTTESIVLPHATTLDGDGHIISVVDPEGGYFSGAVITNEPVSEAQPRVTINVTDVQINAGNLKNKCDSGSARLRGIMLNEASGSVTNVTILALNQGASGCQEGNAIEARSFGGEQTRVTISGNTVLNWQKTGIVVSGDVRARVTRNYVGVSATEQNLAPNSIQFGFGATGQVMHNNVHGSQWLGESNYASTGFLVYQAENVRLSGNTLNYNPFEGNAEVGIYIIDTHNSRFVRNVLFDIGADKGHDSIGGAIYDWGIFDCGTGNILGANQMRGFTIAFERCYPSRGESEETSMTTLSRRVSPRVADEPGVPAPFI